MQDILDLYVERRASYREEEEALKRIFVQELGISGLKEVRRLFHYAIQNGGAYKEDPRFLLIFHEPQTDTFSYEKGQTQADFELAVCSLPGQYNQREDSAEQCMALLGEKDAHVLCDTDYLFYGTLDDADREKIMRYLINPVENGTTQVRERAEETQGVGLPPVFHGFIDADENGLRAFYERLKPAMSWDDCRALQVYFRDKENRDPTETEWKVIDTYWSDHCRHTTFTTHLDDICIQDARVDAAYQEYRYWREVLYRDHNKPMTLMDLATIGAKTLLHEGKLKHLDQSEEINACSVHVEVETEAGTVPYLYQFKNETHNHPTEIEPFGGAATCLGGAIRDPLSGRAYVYQGMRITGAADPTEALDKTLPGKLPQRRICQLSADGFSSYGNQIGMATGFVDEVYHPGYRAKRLELGAVVGACPSDQVVRGTPAPGDVVILVGGRTGRDGCGGATGSSVRHDVDALSTRGAEVQKGNPVEQRKLQRFFRHPEVSRMIIRCNDFGAGGVAVSIGEIARGLDIDLDAVPKKYAHLTATELAISESQERMSCVVASENAAAFIEAAHQENLEATVVATVNDSDRIVMRFGGQTVLSLSRDFVDSSGAGRTASVTVEAPANKMAPVPVKDFEELCSTVFSDKNVATKQGLVERFDATIGAGSVFHPYGGKRQETPTQAMAALLPHPEYQTRTASVFAYGFDPQDSADDPFVGAYNAVTSSVTRMLATGAAPRESYLTLQEYFPSLGEDPLKWQAPFKALLGAFLAQRDFGMAAIGGKDSMSGTFEDLEVPPTLVSFATTVVPAHTLITPELKAPGHTLYLMDIPRAGARVDAQSWPQWRQKFYRLVEEGTIVSAWSLSYGGIIEGLGKMSWGNHIGVNIDNAWTLEQLRQKDYGRLIVETTKPIDNAQIIGTTIDRPELRYGNEKITLTRLKEINDRVFESVYPTSTDGPINVENFPLREGHFPMIRRSKSKVQAVIPVFPGTNCEYDTLKALKRAGADARTLIIRNKRSGDLEESIREFEKALQKTHILVLAGGFSFGDEPDGSAKFIAAFLREQRLRRALEQLIKERDGLVLGICNGFQALIKLGLVPYGEIKVPTADSPTLTFNKIHRHQSRYVQTKIISTQSPWLRKVSAGDMHTIAVSHGEGRLICPPDLRTHLAQNGQIATQYVDHLGHASMAVTDNPNGSDGAIEGLLSPDGKIFGKMGHSERYAPYVGVNISGERDQKLFESAVSYFNGEE